MILEMGLRNFALYEVNRIKSSFDLIEDHTVQMHRIDDEKLSSGIIAPAIGLLNPYCHDQVGKNSRQCPVIREKKTYNSHLEGRCCQFLSLEGDHMGHVCQATSGTNLTLIEQFLFEEEKRESLEQFLPVVHSYVFEALNLLEINQAMSFIRDKSVSDELTGLYNRRYLEEMSTQFIEKNLPEKTPMGFLLIDVDYFKKVNDELGHDAGDMVLKLITRSIKESVRKTDVVIRFGGEEILVLANGIQPGTTKDLAEKIRENIELLSFRYSKKEFKKTASIGTAEFPRDSDHFWICIKHADIALYEAKETGRNRVVDFIKKDQS